MGGKPEEAFVIGRDVVYGLTLRLNSRFLISLSLQLAGQHRCSGGTALAFETSPMTSNTNRHLGQIRVP